jgi:hypothetical protein
MKSIGICSPDAVRAGTASLQSQMPLVCDATVCPTLKPAPPPPSWFIRNDLPER